MRLQVPVAILSVPLCVSAVNVSVPVTPPDSSQPLSSTLISFSLEQDRWPDWVGIDSRNEFTFNALDNYAKLTGKPSKIRVGADSEDHTTWSPTVTVGSLECSLTPSIFSDFLALP